MSSISHAGPDAMVTVKVTYEKTTRRAKMPLRDMVPRVLEEHIRTFLHIRPETKAIIERYSDSAGAYIVLDSDNLPVYKQLYRAAKAKSKLKLRVTSLELTEKTIPKPVTVEDELEATPAEEHIEDISQIEQEEPQSTTEPPMDTPMPPALPALDTLPTEPRLPVRAPRFVKLHDSDMLRATLARSMEEQQQDITGVPENQTQADDATDVEPQPVDPPLVSPGLHLSQSRPVTCPAAFAVCCNTCEAPVTDAHYHCATCDDGDFDLCQSCVDQGITCYDEDHWLIKRKMVDGQLVTSCTERLPPKSKAKKENPAKEALEEEPVKEEPASTSASTIPMMQASALPKIPFEPAGTIWTCLGNTRTCNCCVQELPEHEFLHCLTCEDFDLCQLCFSLDGHGHHPKHAFTAAVPGTKMPDHIKTRMVAGRNQMHQAICDGCDKYITGVRHKCLDCPDWDYCSDCIPNAGFVHANHRFVPVYEALADIHACQVAQPLHIGICCDGPLCSSAQGYPAYIRGVRYKCAVCHDLDFCANCEASPANDHNKTHPLIKFKTPVRHVSVTTTGEHQDGKRRAPMGDRIRTSSTATETCSAADSNSMTAVQAVVDVKPVEPSVVKSEPEPEVKQEPEPEVKEEKTAEVEKSVNELDLRAVFLRDSVADGTTLPPNHVFEQTWVLRNEGNVSWPAGCSVKFVGGDYMGHVDSAHPAGISELVSASESTVCYAPLAPGHEFPFTVLLRTPARAGKIISYWRLTTADGYKFGHRLWCDVNVRMALAEVQPTIPMPIEESKREERAQSDSVMIFPKLDNESPNGSIHEEAQTESNAHEEKAGDSDSLTEGAEDEEWDGSDDFMTDEEYDILDASDEEYLEEQQKKHPRK